MYVPAHYEERDLGVLHALIRSHPLGAWVTRADGALAANHIPFLVDPSPAPLGTLVGHVARANGIWRSFAKDLESLVIFQGPQCYITPSWYPSKRTHGKVVPTWNYAVVHVQGVPRAIEDTDWLLAHVTALSDRHEAGREAPWSVGDAPREYVAENLKAIVGIEIPIGAIVGKWKTSQTRPPADRAGTIEGLLERGDENSRQMAALVRRHDRIEEG